MNEKKLAEFEPPKKKLLTEEDILFKHLYRNQQSTKISLPEILTKKKEFNASTTVLSVTSMHQGNSTLGELLEVNAKVEKTQSLLEAGLNNSEITLYEDYTTKGFDYVHKIHKAVDPSILMKQINDILLRIGNHQDKIPNNKKLNEDLSDGSLEHPLVFLKTREQQLNEEINSSDVNPAKIRRKARKLQNKLANEEKQLLKQETGPSAVNINSKWDQKHEQFEKIAKPEIIHKYSYSCKPANYYTVINNEIIPVNDMDRFELTGKTTEGLLEEKWNVKNSKTSVVNICRKLYLKNLPKGLSETHLKLLFPSVRATDCKVMSGRMRGQAFLTFSSEAEAAVALETMHCSLINGKPLICQFAKG